MKKNIIKSGLCILMVLLLVYLIFASYKNINKEKPITGEVVENTTDKKEVTEEKKEEEAIIPEVTPEEDQTEVEKEETYGKIISIVNDVYLSNGKKYVDVDTIEFFTGDEAYEQAAIDGNLYKDENGNDFLPNGYYIRNYDSAVETYEISEDAILSLCNYVVDPSSTDNSSVVVPVSYEEFELYINNSKGLDQRSRMFWINTKNDIVESIEMQFTP